MKAIGATHALPVTDPGCLVNEMEAGRATGKTVLTW